MSIAFVVSLAIMSRVTFLSAVPLFDYLLPRVPTDQFWAPVWLANQDSVGPAARMFFGLGHWDSQHFIHIAHSGYTFQTDLPFFPLFPTLVGAGAKCLEWAGANVLSALIWSATAMNVVFFVWSAVSLYQLTFYIFRDDHFATLTSAFYCFSPATVFFIAFYSEPLYALLTFRGLLSHHSFKPYRASLWFSAACLTRSNGIVNAGFILHYYLSLAMVHIFYDIENEGFIHKVFRIGRCIATSIALTFVMLLPFALFQFYTHDLLCSDPPRDFSAAVLNHSTTFDIPLLSDKAEYCEMSGEFLLPYTWVQGKFWNVGFLKYWTLRQIPNFALALPIVVIITNFSIRFIYRNRMLIMAPHAVYNNVWSLQDGFPPLVFVYAVHALFLAISSFFVINVQVITRLIASSSPLLYWIAAGYMVTEDYVLLPVDTIFDMFALNRPKISFAGKLIYRYFISYALVGLILFSNGFAWT